MAVSKLTCFPCGKNTQDIVQNEPGSSFFLCFGLGRVQKQVTNSFQLGWERTDPKAWDQAFFPFYMSYSG